MAFKRNIPDQGSITIKAGDYPGYTEKDLKNLSGTFPRYYVEYDGEKKVVTKPSVVESGKIIDEEEFEMQPARMWRFANISELPAMVDEFESNSKKERDRKRLKSQLHEDMSKTTVTIGERVFWADPDSEQNFSGRIRQMEIQGLTVTKWQQGFDTFEVTLDELKQVVAEGTVKNAALWDAYIEAVEAL